MFTPISLICSVFMILQGGGAEDWYRAWDFFCIGIIQQKLTSYPVSLETKDGCSTGSTVLYILN